MSQTSNNYRYKGLNGTGDGQWQPPFQLIDDAGTVQFGVAFDGTLTTGASLINTSSAYTFQSTLEVDGNFSVATNKFTVAAASGNTAVAGTLAVTGASTLTGALTVTAVKPILGASANTPASASAAGTAGMICWDASNIYVCTATNTWKSVAIATF